VSAEDREPSFVEPSFVEPRFVEPRSTPVPRAEIERRLAAFQETLRAEGIDAALIVQNADLYYLAGTVQQSQLLVPADGEPALFTRRTVARAREESPLPVEPLPSLRRLGELVVERCGGVPEVVGLELDVLPVAHFRRYESQLPMARFVDVGSALVLQRAVKSPWEVARIAAAAAVADEVFARIPGLLREGLTEAAFAGLVEAEARALGHQGVIRMRAFNGEMFYGQLLSGVSGAVPSYLDTPLAGTGLSAAVAQGVSFKQIGRGEPVVFDFVPVLDGYTADVTRIFSLGELPGELIQAYACARRAQAPAPARACPAGSSTRRRSPSREAAGSRPISWATARRRCASAVTAWASSSTSCRCSRPTTSFSRRAWCSPSSRSSSFPASAPSASRTPGRSPRPASNA
jgi:Xaa-Pro aminopeptidase